MGLVQMNTRIEESLKRAGDEVFASINLTPSEVVRAVWAYAAEHAEAPSIVSEALSTGAGDAQTLNTAYRVDVAQQAADIISGYRAKLGVSAPDKLDLIDYDELREDAWTQKLSNEGLA